MVCTCLAKTTLWLHRQVWNVTINDVCSTKLTVKMQTISWSQRDSRGWRKREICHILAAKVSWKIIKSCLLKLSAISLKYALNDGSIGTNAEFHCWTRDVEWILRFFGMSFCLAAKKWLTKRRNFTHEKRDEIIQIRFNFTQEFIN